MNVSYDLLTSPWVPCIEGDGKPVELGLREALARAHELRALHGESPLVTAAIVRLLLAILHRVYGPADPDEWADLWEVGRWDARQLGGYLDRWQHRFDLFHPERPFYQAADARVKVKSVASLIHEVASGNNATLFDHHTDQRGAVLTPAEAARMLVTAQAFGLAGLSGLKQTYTDAPCASGIVFVVQGRNLFETMALNMLMYPDGLVMPWDPCDRPSWEMDDPFVPDRSYPFGYLDYLTWHNRRVLYVPEQEEGRTVVRQMTMAPALRLDASVLNPMWHYRIDDKRGPIPLPFVEGRALWRNSAALFRVRGVKQRPPRTFAWLAELVSEGYLEREQTRRYRALGMSKKQAKVNFYRTERWPLPLRYLQEPDLVESLQEALTMAEDTSRQLWGTARTLATLLLSPEEDRRPLPQDLGALTGSWGTERHYWSRLELPFHQALEDLPGAKAETLADWQTTLRRTAWRAFDRVAEGLGHAPYTLKALVRAREQLAAGLAKALPT